MNNVTILGAGSWGSALGLVLAKKGIHVNLWARSKNLAENINKNRLNSDKLPNVTFPSNIVCYTNIDEAIANNEIIIIAIPSQFIRDNIKMAKNLFNPNKIYVSCSKGIEQVTNMLISEVIEDEIGKTNFVVLSGPSHAEEVAQELPTTIVSASTNLILSKQIQDLFSTPYLRVYTNTDIIGVQVAGASKNVIALCAGITDGLGFGDNTKAALITRGIAEISRLGIKLGAKQDTFSGLTGLGDLIVTCTSMHSRNRKAGILFGKGYSLQDVESEIKMVAEGITTTKAVYELSNQLGISMPIATECFNIIYNGKNPNDAVLDLMNRDKKFE